MSGTKLQTIAALMVGTAWAISVPATWANDDPAIVIDLPAQTLEQSLRSVASSAGWEIYMPASDIEGIAAAPLKGNLPPSEAIGLLLKNTDLEASFLDGSVIIRARSIPDENSRKIITVTGSRITGAPPSAPVRVITAEDMRRGGQADLGEVIRSSPVNFGGGQNPGVGTSQGNSDVNVNGSSSPNLLGLGPNATLTLLNGNRLSYTGLNSAIDISAIPATAVDRVEIITDGASAIYGADAVAGVVNVILKRDYEGVSALARVGGATDGGNFQQQYNLTGGAKWAGGGILGVLDHSSNSDIPASSRSYAKSMATDSSLYPRLRRDSALISLFQDIGSRLKANVDLMYKDGRQDVIAGFLGGQPHTASGAAVRADTRSWLIAPSLTASLGASWNVHLLSSFGADKSQTHSDIFAGGSVYGASYRQYDNDAQSVELNADGPLFSLPAGDVRVALGGGYRRTGIELNTTTLGVTSNAFKEHSENGFGFAELLVPILSPAQNSRLGRALRLTGAFRYEANSGTDSVALPKLGIVYEPFDGLALKGSWGRSFRLPTLYQRYGSYSAVLYQTARYATGFPADSTMIILGGANADLKPEKSESWTFSAEFRPVEHPEFSGSISFFHFDYTDRVATPLTSAIGVLNNPIYNSLVTLDPSTSLQQSLISGAAIGLQNGTTGTYDPSRVVAILDGRDRNMAREIYKGISLSMRYLIGDPDREALDLSFDGNWIDSSRQLFEGLPTVDLSGTIFNPPKLKGRVGASYITPRLTLSAFTNLSSSLLDNRKLPAYRLRGLATLDLSAIAKVGGGFELGANILNVFNARPPLIVTGSGYDTPFDTTNYSPIGRFLSVQIRRSW
ncbi:TonB-dependent receptor domain-containing protein [Sphingobium yanoikuyae]|uniref:TonB-dependent receptor domain-containing protein n=1 Tax=Sphingobium yanoikuyae TaxID=13690 RepID=UPI0035B05304